MKRGSSSSSARPRGLGSASIQSSMKCLSGRLTVPRILYRLHTNLAICSLAAEALDDAESWLWKALQDKPLDDLAEALLARILLARGEVEAAKRKASSILEHNSTQSHAWIVIILTSAEPIAQSGLPAELRKESVVPAGSF